MYLAKHSVEKYNFFSRWKTRNPSAILVSLINRDQYVTIARCCYTNQRWHNDQSEDVVNQFLSVDDFDDETLSYSVLHHFKINLCFLIDDWFHSALSVFMSLFIDFCLWNMEQRGLRIVKCERRRTKGDFERNSSLQSPAGHRTKRESRLGNEAFVSNVTCYSCKM